MMPSLILRTAARLLLPLLILFSVFLTLRGHDAPGGAFVGGLVAAVAFALHALAFDAATTRRALRFGPLHLAAAGLLLATGTGALAIVAGRPFLTALWREWRLPGGAAIETGTPYLFEAGIYLAVFGMTVTAILRLSEE